MFKRMILVAGLCLMPVGIVLAGSMTATTESGDVVILHEDGTWKYEIMGESHEVSEDKQKKEVMPLIRLTVERKTPFSNSCSFGIRMTNHAPFPVAANTLRFVAYKKGGIPFTDFTRSFTGIRPTLSQYKEIDFVAITCDDIEEIKVEGTRGCQAGELTKHSSSPEDCLAIVDVLASDIVKIGK